MYKLINIFCIERSLNSLFLGSVMVISLLVMVIFMVSTRLSYMSHRSFTYDIFRKQFIILVDIMDIKKVRSILYIYIMYNCCTSRSLMSHQIMISKLLLNFWLSRPYCRLTICYRYCYIANPILENNFKLFGVLLQLL